MLRVALFATDQMIGNAVANAIEAAEGGQVIARITGEESDWGQPGMDAADVIVVCLRRTNSDGVRFVKRLVNERSVCWSVVVVSDRVDLEHAAELLKAGVSGYLTTDGIRSHLLTAVKAVHRGRRFICPSIRDELAVKYMEFLEQRSSN